MSKANRITRLTSAACEQIQARMLEACRQIASDHGLVIESTGWRGLEPGFSFEPAFRISITAPDGKTLNLDKEMFALLAEQYGLEAADFEREFIAGGERFRITGIDPRRPKYPSPSSVSPIAAASSSPPTMLPCCSKLRSNPDVHQSFFNLAKIPASSRQGHVGFLFRCFATQIPNSFPPDD
ncbi:hypothetical protein [Sinorhizobium fredii]|uniref:hypothetical protein n=1 Tax=Rhizobium fredii TaxID=380 RepID=UPI001FCBADFC|nr:hypothetical protein [Sinorhizobium fredii]